MSAFRAALVAFSAALLTAACAAGEHAATSEEKPSLDGTQGKVGSIQLEGVALHAPTKSSYSRGDDVGLAVYIANNGRSSDTLTKVTSPAFTGGWAVTSTGSPSATTSASPSSAATPQQIGAGAALGLGLTNLTPDGTGSPHSLVLKGLAASSAPLYPGSTVKITFSFARAGQTTLNVPVQITAQPNTQTLPANGASSG